MIEIPADMLADAPRRWVVTGPGRRQRVVDPAWKARVVAELQRLADLAAARQRFEILEAARLQAAEERARMEAAILARAERAEAARLGGMFPLRRLMEEVAAQHGLTGSDILGRRRDMQIADARAHAAYELRRHGPSLTQLGTLMRRDHTTILAALRRWPARAAALGIPCEPLPAHLAVAPKEV